MRTFATLGLRPDDFLEPLPDLSPQASLAVSCWSFCDGWAPERWVVFAALHHVPDWAALAELMQAIRDQTRKQEAARRG